MNSKVKMLFISLLVAFISCTESYQDQFEKGLDTIEKVDAHFIPTYYDSIDIVILNNDRKVNNVIKDRKIKTEIFMMPGIRELSYPSTDTIYHVRSFENYLYALYDGAVSRKIPIPYIPALSRKDIRRIEMDSKIFDYIPSYGIDIKDYYFLSFSGGNYGMFVYEKKNNKWIGYTNSKSRLDFILPSKFVGCGDKNVIIGVIDAALANALLDSKVNYSSDDRDKLKSISNSENPSLLIYHMK